MTPDLAIGSTFEQLARQYRVSADTVVRREDLRDQFLEMTRPHCPGMSDDDILRRLVNLRRKKRLVRLRDL